MNALTGTGSLVRLALRRDRIMLAGLDSRLRHHRGRLGRGHRRPLQHRVLARARPRRPSTTPRRWSRSTASSTTRPRSGALAMFKLGGLRRGDRRRLRHPARHPAHPGRGGGRPARAASASTVVGRHAPLAAALVVTVGGLPESGPAHRARPDRLGTAGRRVDRVRTRLGRHRHRVRRRGRGRRPDHVRGPGGHRHRHGLPRRRLRPARDRRLGRRRAECPGCAGSPRSAGGSRCARTPGTGGGCWCCRWSSSRRSPRWRTRWSSGVTTAPG